MDCRRNWLKAVLLVCVIEATTIRTTNPLYQLEREKSAARRSLVAIMEAGTNYDPKREVRLPLDSEDQVSRQKRTEGDQTSDGAASTEGDSESAKVTHGTAKEVTISGADVGTTKPVSQPVTHGRAENLAEAMSKFINKHQTEQANTLESEMTTGSLISGTEGVTSTSEVSPSEQTASKTSQEPAMPSSPTALKDGPTTRKLSIGGMGIKTTQITKPATNPPTLAENTTPVIIPTLHLRETDRQSQPALDNIMMSTMKPIALAEIETPKTLMPSPTKTGIETTVTVEEIVNALMKPGKEADDTTTPIVPSLSPEVIAVKTTLAEKQVPLVEMPSSSTSSNENLDLPVTEKASPASRQISSTSGRTESMPTLQPTEDSSVQPNDSVSSSPVELEERMSGSDCAGGGCGDLLVLWTDQRSSDAYWALGSLVTVLLLLTVGVLYTGLLKKRNYMSNPISDVNCHSPAHQRRADFTDLLKQKLNYIKTLKTSPLSVKPHTRRNGTQGSRYSHRYDRLPLVGINSEEGEDEDTCTDDWMSVNMDHSI